MSCFTFHVLFTHPFPCSWVNHSWVFKCFLLSASPVFPCLPPCPHVSLLSSVLYFSFGFPLGFSFACLLLLAFLILKIDRLFTEQHFNVLRGFAEMCFVAIYSADRACGAASLFTVAQFYHDNIRMPCYFCRKLFQIDNCKQPVTKIRFFG